MSHNELLLVEFLSQVAETTSFTFKGLLSQFPENKKLQEEFGHFVRTFNEVAK